MREGGSSPEVIGQGARWTAEDFRYYLLAQSHNSPVHEYCLEHHKFPQEIALSPIWEETFERMRVQTARDHREYWSMIGVTKQRDKVMLLHELMPGEKAFVSGEAMSLALARARERGIANWVGDIHSHPASFGGKLLGNHDAFSLGDLYALLYSRHEPAVRFVVGPNQNVAAFRSQETQLIPSWLTQETFQKFWDRLYFVRLRRGDTLGVNMAIAKRNQLALYRSKPGEALARIYP